jgi:hypothetical protein
MKTTIAIDGLPQVDCRPSDAERRAEQVIAIAKALATRGALPFGGTQGIARERFPSVRAS